MKTESVGVCSVSVREMAALDRVLELNFTSEDEEQFLSDDYDWALPRAFNHKRHSEKIEGSDSSPQSWRMKERVRPSQAITNMKTVSVALVICLNVGVDPPGVIKTQPCARFECWIDPVSLSPQKALETIGNALQKQYERWQPRARYKTSLDPTVDEVKKLCSSLRRNAKDERVLYHYNGHGVPQPTTNGEIWVFNRNYTQYIPLSIYDLQTWMGSPSIYVYDCSNAGLIIKSFHQFAEQHEKEYEEMLAKSAVMSGCTPPNFSACIQLAACGENQLLPMNPDLPADLFTACLTTPIRIALRWFILQHRDKLIPKITLEMVDKLPGQLNDRRTMLGELNWIFTAITDTIAWNLLPRHLFQKLFRQDLLVASLFRNFLLAERIMRTYDCSPTSSPKLPPTSQHPMWAAWDLALDLCLSQLPGVLEEIQANQVVPPVGLHGNGVALGSNGVPNPINLETILTNHNPSPFFEEQLTAFQVWLEFGSENRQPPEQLPIVLQVLLSQVHRVKALELLGRFLDLGWWAVNLALSVGIFPYVLKLLQSSAKELRPLLVFIWAKILAVDHSCQTDLVRDGSHRYFISMVGDTSLPFEQRTMAAFVLTNVVRNYRQGQQASLQANSIATCLEALDESDKELRRWVCICLGLTWAGFPAARWCGVRDSAHEKIYSLLEDPNPEVRAAAVFALGTFINSTTEKSEHANAIDHSIAMTIINKLCSDEASPLVRQEIVVALHNFMLTFENNFVALEQHRIINEELHSSSPSGGSGMRRISSQTRMRILNSATATATVTGAESHLSNLDPMRRVASSSSLSSLMLAFNTAGSSPGKSSSAVGGVYQKVYSVMTNYKKDPYKGVALLAKAVIEHFRSRAKEHMSTNGLMKLSLTGGVSATSTPVKGSIASTSTGSPGSSATSQSPDSGSANMSRDSAQAQPKEITPLIATKYIEWCWDRFARPTIPGYSNCLGLNFGSTIPHTQDTQDPSHHTREWRYMRNTTIRRDCFRRHKSFPGKVDEQIFSSKNVQHSHASTPSSASSSSHPSFTFSTLSSTSIVKLHDYENVLLASEGSMFTIYDIQADHQRMIGKWENSNDSRITCIEWVNCHDESLIMVGGDDGSLRFWHPDYNKSGKPRLVTSWQALSEVGQLNKSSKSVGLLAKWDHERERVLTTGDSKVVRIWDVKSEMRTGDWPTGHDCAVTSLDFYRCEPNLAILGLEDGAVRLIDVRLPPADCGVVTWREFGETWLVGATLRHDRTIISGSASGVIRFFDLRSRSATKTIETSIDITAFAVHYHLPYFSSGCLNHSVNVYGYVGQSTFLANGIREGLFISGRIGTVASVHFHPYKPLLATADSYAINVYKAKSWQL